MVLGKARMPMNIRPTFFSFFAAASVAASSIAIVWAQEAGPIGESERIRAAKLNLGEELPPPRPEEEEATKTLVAATVGSLKELKSKGVEPIPRDQHPHHQGSVRATFTVADGLPEHLKVGIFSK